MNSKYPKISIITPNFNGEMYLEQTIRSVLDQQYPNLEYIVIDGGSTDKSVSILESFASQLQYWISEPDMGQADAINKGFKKATGDWIGFLNSDDLYVPNALFKLAERILQTPDTDWIVGGTEIFGEDNTVYRTRFAEFTYQAKPIDWTSFRVTSPQPSSFWSKKVLKDVGFLDMNYQYAFDCEFWLRMHQKGFSPVNLTEVLARFRFHAESKTGQSRRPFLKDHYNMIEKHKASFSESEIALATNILRKLESDALVAESLHGKQAFADLWKAIRLNPGCVKNRMFLGAVKRSIFS